MRIPRLLLLALTLVCAFAAGPPPASANFPGHDGKFVYRTMNAIWTISKGGANATPIVPDANGAEYPSFSPSGKSIVFDANLDGDYDIYTVAESGGTPHLVTHNDAVDWGASQGFGGHIVYVCMRGGSDEICTIKADGSARKRLTSADGDDQYPDWSPDMSSIVFTSERGGSFDIFVMDADGRHQHRLTMGTGDETQPDFSPNGRKIVYVMDGTSLWVMNASGENQHQILQSGGETPTWAPSGSRIAFADGNDIVTVLPDGSDLVDVTSNDTAGDNIGWQPK